MLVSDATEGGYPVLNRSGVITIPPPIPRAADTTPISTDVIEKNATLLFVQCTSIGISNS